MAVIRGNSLGLFSKNLPQATQADMERYLDAKGVAVK